MYLTQEALKRAAVVDPTQICVQIRNNTCGAPPVVAAPVGPGSDFPPVPDDLHDNLFLGLIGGFRRCRGEVTRERAEENDRWSEVAKI
jgi:hypothetical protein